ncbi:interferon alpha/beta receptor 2 isoform X2 [Kryptolebias marmoratus]|uniref:interferon alpha/beta receptor 2 isoform X2 n=1 Tax=Kryptolebias marmoratus TaxID=37003 RepID=UPI0018ACD66B|nr:interferon alpha/beta receptor 2 isoform X2 [Kryptolebias marmoratus]
MLLLLLLLLLHLQLGLCVPLPAPSNVSISSYNMMHSLRVWPGPRTPPEARFVVQTLSSRARVRAVASNQTSKWTISRQFQPLSDTVLGPPDVSVSGCGNCLILQVRNPTEDLLEHSSQLKDVLWDLVLSVRRTRDGAEFRLTLPYKPESTVSYLQPGVEYCVTASFSSSFSQKSVSSERRCSFTSPPPDEHSYLVLLGLFVLFSITAFLLLVGWSFRSQVQTCSFYQLNLRSQTSCLMKTPLTQETLT